MDERYMLPTLVILLLTALAAVAQPFTQNDVAFHVWRMAAAIPPASGYLLEQDAEGTGTPIGWTDSGSPDWDYTTTALVGSQSLYCADNTRSSLSPTFADTSDLWLFFAVRYDTTPSANVNIVNIKSGATLIAYLNLRTTANQVRGYHGTANGYYGSFAPDTTYYVWLHYVAGTGANGAMQVYFSTTTTRPGSPNINITTGTATAAANNITFIGANGSYVIYDKMRADNAEIGNAPE